MHRHFSTPETVAEVDLKCRTAGVGLPRLQAALADGMIETLTPIRRRAEEFKRDRPGWIRSWPGGANRPGRSPPTLYRNPGAVWASSSNLMACAPIERIIKAAVERGASDLHIKAGDLFRARIDGKLVPLTKQRLTPEQTRAIAIKLMTTDEDRQRIDELKDYDCSWGMPGVGRFRVNILRQRSSFDRDAGDPLRGATLEDLGLPPALGQLTDHVAGLILVTGITGAGRAPPSRRCCTT